VQFAFLYRTYIGFPSYLKFEGTGLLYYGYSSLVNYTIEGPGRLVSGVRVTYEIKMCFWNFMPKPNLTGIILEHLTLMIKYTYGLVEERILPLNNVTVNEEDWLNISVIWRPIPLVTHIQIVNWSWKEFLNALKPVKEAYMWICLSGYFMVNNKLYRFSVPIATDYRMKIILLDWMSFFLYQIFTIVVLLSYKFLKWYQKI